MPEAIRYYAHGSGLRRHRLPLTPEERQALHGLQKGRCYLCGQPFAGRRNPALRASEDHVRPVSGGGLDYHNRLLAHHDCNQAKGNRKAYPCELLLAEFVWLNLEAGSNFRHAE